MKFISGPIMGLASGKLGSIVFTHGRYGQSARTRVKPVGVTSSFTEAVRNNMTTTSRAWAALTEAQKLTWNTWAQNNPITDRLGQKQVLAGHAAYNQINGRRLLYPGTQLSVPPIGGNPASLLTAAVTYDIGAGGVTIETTPNPLTANTIQWVEAAVVNSAGTRYTSNLRKWIGVNPNGFVNPFDIKSMVEARFGTLAVGQILSLWIYSYDYSTGLISAPLYKSGTIVTT